ncbi:MAG: DUF4330 domain-containing protein [Vampirovibrio sp.]|nr:DUF4330 domain-containing protein [Vampirovibrio sp.]
MALIDENGRLFGKLNAFDALAAILIVAITAGFFLVQSGTYRTSSQVVERETDIQYQVLLKYVRTLQPDVFEPGKTLSVTIRNQPRGDIKIVDSTVKRAQAIIQDGKGSYTLVDDPTDPHNHNMLVTLQDHAMVTADGYVTNGVKVKIGMDITLEGFDYQLRHGTIVAIRDLSEQSPSS